MTPEQLAAMEQALEALNLARAAHGQMLLSDPPQEAWKAWKVGSVTRSAMEALRTVIEQAKRQQALDKMAENERELGIQMQPEPVGEAYLCDKCQTPFDGAWECPSCGHRSATKEPVYTHPAPAAPVQQDPSGLGCGGALCGLSEYGGNHHPLCKQAPAAPVQEPDGIEWLKKDGGYFAPPAAQRQWVSLTDEELELLNDCGDTDSYKFARAIEAKLREKNGGAA